MTKTPSITIIGHVCIDQNVIDGVSYEKWGSSPMYIANYLQEKYAVQPSILAAYGNDFTKYTPGFHFINKAAGLKTLVYKNIVTNGHRTQYCHNTTDATVPTITPDVIQTLRTTDIVIVTPMTPHLSTAYVLQILQHVPKECLKVLLPQGYMREINDKGSVGMREFIEAPEFLSKFDVLVTSDEDYPNVYEWAAHSTIKHDPLSIVVTQAEKGAALFVQGRQTNISTIPISFKDIKNPVGSGDIFSAQLSFSLYNGFTINEAIRSANEATGASLRLS